MNKTKIDCADSTEAELNDNEIFTIEARRCKRCGGLLTNSKTILDGYGHVCKKKFIQEKRERAPIPGQMSILDFW